MGDVGKVGGKNASLGEMISQLSRRASVCRGSPPRPMPIANSSRKAVLAARIKDRLASLNIEDVTALAAAGAQIRQWIIATPFPRKLEEAITKAYQQLESKIGHAPVVAVRSSATAEDLPEASFAGQQETF